MPCHALRRSRVSWVWRQASTYQRPAEPSDGELYPYLDDSSSGRDYDFYPRKPFEHTWMAIIRT